MVTAILRTTRASFRGRRWPSVLAVAIVVMAAATITLALDVRRGADGPFDRVFSETRGGHVEAWAPSAATVNLGVLLHQPGVVASIGPFRFGIVTASPLHDRADQVVVEAAARANRPVERLLMRGGRYAEAPDEIVLERTFARAEHLHVGDTVSLGKPARPLHVVGIATTTETGPYPSSSPGLAWVLPATFASLHPRQVQSAVALRLSNPAASGAFIQHARTLLPAVVSFQDWHDTRASVTQRVHSAAFVLEVFSLFALLTVALVLANTIGGRVLARGRDIAILKSVGCTPRLVAAMLLAEQLAIGLVGALIGAALGTALAPIFLAPAADLLATTAPNPVDLFAIAGSVVLTLLVIGLFTLIPAWRGGRLAVVSGLAGDLAAVRPSPSRLAGLAARLRLPPAMVLGVKDAFARRSRAILTIASLTLTMSTIVVALAMEATYSRVISDPALRAKPYDVIVFHPQRLSDARLQRIADEQPGVRGSFTIAEQDGDVPGVSDPITTRALGGDYRAFPYAIPQGRMLAGPGEAIVGIGLLDQLHLHIGDPLHVRVSGKLLSLRIVGRYVEPDDGARTAIFDERTLESAGGSVSGRELALELRKGVDAHRVATSIERATGYVANASVTSDDVENERSGFRRIIYGLDGVLLLIGLGNLLTTLLLLVRERARDFGIFKTLGLTPRQVGVAVTSGASVHALVAAVVGIPVGVVVFDWVAIALNPTDGPDVVTNPTWWSLVLLAPVAIALAALASYIPARAAARMRVADALRYE
jgi:putative ABC transport system permease protein